MKKLLLYFLLAIPSLTAGLFLLNLQLTERLEKYLKKELIARTAEATNGFYRLSFDKLSISFFRGELKLEGIRLAPDSAVFRNWTQKDSLPENYVVAHIGVIDFKGVNLTWRWSYKKLHFNSFEIRKPDIRIFNSYYSSRAEKKSGQAEAKTLYEMISPYIDVLSVKTLNLENASVSYKVVNPFSPIVYALANVSFHAYGFRLDKNSLESGKLLYCDNFNFVTNQPQNLLTNNDFTLTTDSIRLSTADSIIYISQINLRPQDELWKEKRQRPDRYLNAHVETVEVNGIAFEREAALNYLTARSFKIISSDIRAYNLANTNKRKKPSVTSGVTPVNADSLVNSLSLYEIISPVLHSVSIQTVGIEQAKLQYSLALKDSIEEYKLANFNFQANEFLIDSVSEVQHGFWYSRSFAFEATGIEGRLTARNHRLEVKRMALDTETGDFSIEHFRLRPLSLRSRNDYMYGSIDTVSIRGLQYDNGISAGAFKIDNPTLRYVIAPSCRKAAADKKTISDSRVDVEGILNPFLRYLSVKKVSLNNASVTLDDRSAQEPVTYRLDGFNFFATDILMNEQTGRGSGLFFDYGDMGFSFSNFDNYLPGKAYRLAVRKGQFSTRKGILRLQDIRLTPQDSLKGKRPGVYISASIPLLSIAGLKRLPESLDHLSLERLELLGGTGDYTRLEKDKLLQHLQLDTTDLMVQGLVVDSLKQLRRVEDVRFSTRNLSYPLDGGFYTLKIGNVDLANWNLQVKGIQLVSPYPKMEFAYLQPHHKDWFDVRVERLSLSDMDIPGYFKDRVLRIKEVQVENAELQNFKNQKIPVPHHLVPMIYSGLQKAPVKLDIQRVGVKNFSVIYEELAKKGTVPGKFFITDMNGVFTGFTNIVSSSDQYIRLDANGKLMGKGAFTATWQLPVDSLNNRFLLNAHMADFDLTALNELITPLASAEVQSGHLNELTFHTEASSEGATIDMLFLYSDLRAALLKEKDGMLRNEKFLSGLVNRVLKHDNPAKTKHGVADPRRSSVSVVRDPYHSTFNYIWQILRPALVESVGVSKKKQDAAQHVATFFTKVKDFFKGKKKAQPIALPEAEEEPVQLEFE